jgi:hypothetical protein
MKVLVSDEFERQAKIEGLDLYPSLKEVVRTLEGIQPADFPSRSMIHKLPGTGEDIYIFRHQDLRFFLTLRGEDVVLIGVKKAQLDVSKGQRLRFAVNGQEVSGVIVRSTKQFGFWASVVVETESEIPENAQLSIPDLPETGGCGLAHQIKEHGRTLVELSVGYSYIDLSTIGK